MPWRNKATWIIDKGLLKEELLPKWMVKILWSSSHTGKHIKPLVKWEDLISWNPLSLNLLVTFDESHSSADSKTKQLHHESDLCNILESYFTILCGKKYHWGPKIFLWNFMCAISLKYSPFCNLLSENYTWKDFQILNV